MSNSNPKNTHKISIVMGSDSDLKTMKPAIDIIKEFELETDVSILSAHRTPIEMMEYAKYAEKNNIKVIIAGAGGSAHLPGMIASITSLPVIGVPVQSKILKGMDSLLSIVQMPTGVPVATVAIDGGKNAGILAIQIISLIDEDIREKFKIFRENLKQTVKTKNSNLKKLGIRKYIEKY